MKVPLTKLSHGFTLVELMVTVVIISIITAIAYPSYRDNVNRSKRADARALLLENAQFMERFFTENNSYSQSNAAVPVAPVLPNLVSPRGATGARVNYNISFRALPALSQTTFAIQAIPANSMSSDKCGTFTLNQLGQRGTVGNSGGMTSETCWTR
jgi:type IV pilus assembly protein PilE